MILAPRPLRPSLPTQASRLSSGVGLLGGLAVALLALSGCETVTAGNEGFLGGSSSFPGTGDTFPASTVQSCDGEDIALDRIILDHDVTYVTFAAKWCKACIEEAPVINALVVDAFAGQSVRAVQVLVESDANVPPTQGLCASWRDDLGARFDVVYDADQEMVRDHFGEQVSRLPIHFIMTSDRIIRFASRDRIPEDLDQLIRDWLP